MYAFGTAKTMHQKRQNSDSRAAFEFAMYSMLPTTSPAGHIRTVQRVMARLSSASAPTLYYCYTV